MMLIKINVDVYLGCISAYIDSLLCQPSQPRLHVTHSQLTYICSLPCLHTVDSVPAMLTRFPMPT